MTPFSIALAIFTMVAAICIAILIIVPADAANERFAVVVFCIFFAATAGATILGINWDSILVRRADQFMLTRDATYACTDMGPSSCKKSILEWQKDSTWYANKVSYILKNIKETK